MAIRKCRLVKEQPDGAQDTVYLETSSDIVIRPSGETVENALAGLKTTIGSVGLPAGGTTGQVPSKRSDDDHDVEWVDLPTPSETAASATKLATPRTIGVNLASDKAVDFDGTEDVTTGVSGILPIANGGTGNTTGLAASATKLATARTFRTNLASTATASFNGTANVTPGVTGILPVANGGAGASSLANLKDSLSIGSKTNVAPDAPNVAGAALGSVVNWCDIDWYVVESTTHYVVLGAKTYFGSWISYPYSSDTYYDYYTPPYEGSVLYSRCLELTLAHDLLWCNYAVPLGGLPFFIPTVYQFQSYSWYKTPKNAILYDNNSKAVYWWLSTGFVRMGNQANNGPAAIYCAAVADTGAVVSSYQANSVGACFRPHIMIKL